ncbi:MAG: S8 family serine peptidase [Gammaproteobacteria bacterium]|nr:S8 family serine peptidase [Gammaproteobacteria bacterium]
MKLKPSFVLRNAVAIALGSALAFPVVSTASEHALGRILVKTKANVPQAKLDALLNNNNASIISTIDGINVHVIKVPEHAEENVVMALSHNPNIEFAELDTLQELVETVPNDTYYGSAWHLPKVNAPGAWDMSMGTNVTVAVLDTGVDSTHPDLKANMLPGFNTVDNTTNTTDIAGHGTKVAGVIGAIGNNSAGVAGMAWNVKILPLRVSNQSSGSAYTSDLAEAVTWAANHGADVANASYAMAGSGTMDSAAAYLKSKGGLITISAGNDGAYYATSDSKNMIVVSATDSGDNKTSWSTYGDFVDVAAPGLSIWTTTNGGGYGAPSGTSFSAPLTAGVLALIKSANPNLSPDEVENILESTAKDLGAPGWDTSYGHGRVDAYQAVLTAMGTTGSGGGSSSGGTVADTTAPSVSLNSPGNTVSGTVNISASAADDTQLDSLAIYAGSTLLGSTSNGSLSVSWNTTLVADGNITLKAVAVDSSGNTSNKTASVTVANNIANDTVAPTVNIVGISEGQTISRNTSVTIDAADDVALSTVNCYINGSLVSSGNTSLTCNINVKKLKSGSHNLSANATDKAGNKTSKSVNFSIGGSSTSGSTGGGKGRKK